MPPYHINPHSVPELQHSVPEPQHTTTDGHPTAVPPAAPQQRTSFGSVFYSKCTDFLSKLRPHSFSPHNINSNRPVVYCGVLALFLMMIVAMSADVYMYTGYSSSHEAESTKCRCLIEPRCTTLATTTTTTTTGTTAKSFPISCEYDAQELLLSQPSCPSWQGEGVVHMKDDGHQQQAFNLLVLICSLGVLVEVGVKRSTILASLVRVTPIIVTLFDYICFLVFDIFGDHQKKSLLGLGDIVIPGFFSSQLLRFSLVMYARRRQPSTNSLVHVARSLNIFSWDQCYYFHLAFVAYILSLLHMGVMVFFNAAQPALLYIVPWLLIATLLFAIIRGDFKALISFEEEEHPPTEETEERSLRAFVVSELFLSQHIIAGITGAILILILIGADYLFRLLHYNCNKRASRRAVELYPSNSLAWHNLGTPMADGETVTVNGQSYTKRDCYRRALELDPSYSRACLELLGVASMCCICLSTRACCLAAIWRYVESAKNRWWHSMKEARQSVPKNAQYADDRTR